MNYQYDLISINHEQRLYVMKSGNGCSCYGFDVIAEKVKKIIKALGQLDMDIHKVGSPEMYYTYMVGLEMLRKTGKKYDFELNPALIGLEGKRIECLMYGEKTRFIVGKSTGFIPIHLEIKTRRSSGGMAIHYDTPISNIQILNS